MSTYATTHYIMCTLFFPYLFVLSYATQRAAELVQTTVKYFTTQPSTMVYHTAPPQINGLSLPTTITPGVTKHQPILVTSGLYRLAVANTSSASSPYH
ncbi:hypothetical protein J3A83DRAFT_3802053 [Scleroderma citrinum]